MARSISPPRTITVLLAVDDQGCPASPDSSWTKYLDRQDELQAGHPIEDVEWRTGTFSTLEPGDRIFIIASHGDREAEPNAPKQRAIIGYGEATGSSYFLKPGANGNKVGGNHVLLRLRVALKPNQALRKIDVEKLIPGVILWDKPTGKYITEYHDEMKALFDQRLAQIDYFNTGVTSGPGRFGSNRSHTPNPARRKQVEDNAINLVWDRFEKIGYRIENRQDDNCGWDLEAIKGTERLKLEVKGLSGIDLNADLTVNEFEKMRTPENLAQYRVCVLLDALKPSETNLHIIAYDAISQTWKNQHCRSVYVEPKTAARLTWLNACG